MNEPNQYAPNSAAVSASKKLDEFFSHLNSAEQKVISELVRASLLQAAEHFEQGEHGQAVPEFVTGLTGQHAPVLVKSLRLPGSLGAHSIPACNSSALAAIRADFKKAR